MSESIESIPSRYLKFVGKHFFRAAFEKELNIDLLRVGDMNYPDQEDIDNCSAEKVQIGDTCNICLKPLGKTNTDKIMIYLHGGAYVSGPNIFHWKMISKLVEESGFTAYVPLYSLAPEHSYKQGVENVFETYRHLRSNHPETEITLIGDSAGGGLALSVVMQLRDMKEQQPEKLVLLSPWLDLTLSNPLIEKIAKKDSLLAPKGLKQAASLWCSAQFKEDDPCLSPIYGDFTGIPDTLVLIGTHEIFYPDTFKMKTKAEEAGVSVSYEEVPGMFHAWMTHVPYVKEANVAIEKVIQFLTRK